MKNYKTIEGLYKHFILNEENKSVDAGDAWGDNVWYYNWCKFRGIDVLPMVNIETKDFMLRFDPCTDEQYQEYENICEENDNPSWIVLS